jgi:basic amino acid/polyamine antiporter, APA family
MKPREPMPDDLGTATPSLARRLGTADAVVIGLGSMIGAGVFAAFGPAAQVAGSGLLIGLGVAAVIAYCNATASAQLAAVYPVSGGTYVYGGKTLGEWWGFTAGWAFVIGKTASCAAMALTFASYAVTGPVWVQRLAALVAVVVLAALNYVGVTRTAAATRVLVSLTLVALGIFVFAVLSSGAVERSNVGDMWSGGFYGVLQAAGLLFFAFAGYARIATMGEEVKDPNKTIPRAIPAALFIVVGVYALVGMSALLVAGPDLLADSASPLLAAADAAGRSGIGPVLRAGAAVASLGALLAMLAGIGRTSLAMARNADLPQWLAAIHPRFRVPHHAEVALAVLVCTLVITSDLRGALGFSSFGVLIYYAIANASAFTQPANERRWPRWLNILGLVGCLVLAAALPIGSVLAGLALLAIGLLGRLIVLRRRRRSADARP